MPVLQSAVAPVDGPRLRRCLPCLPAIKPDRIKTAKALVEKALKLHRVFSVHGPYPVIRAALWSRGWVERRLPRPVHKTQVEDDDDGDDGEASPDAADAADEDEKEEKRDDMYALMSRMVRNETTYFYWTTRRDSIDCHSLRKDQMINHYANAASFTTKVGLCVNLRNLQWFDSADPDTFFPRCYRLGAEDEKHAFIEDFRRTACTSLLQHVVETQNTEAAQEEAKNKLTNRKRSSIGPRIVQTALRMCQDFLIDLEHGDIDRTAETCPSEREQQWAHFLQQYYLVVHEGAEIRGSGVFVGRCEQMLSRLKEVCPQLDTDGVNNIWIIKPGAKSRGRGIICMNRLDDILALVDNDRAMMKDSKWVVQKYLERPLLVHDTKFDVRQWFLVTDWNPLTVWFYSECYLRFSTQPYSTKNLDSSVHLCNNSIQKHFQPSVLRHPALPEDNMWSCAQFRCFLNGLGCEEQWESVVVPGMRQAVIRALQTAQDLVEPRKASFELYGADFMLGQDLRPWLLEINSSPTMACSTAVTSRLCPAVQLDTLRVVLDRRTNPHAHTGGFQLIYKQPAVEVPQYVGVNLVIEGAPIKRCRPQIKPPVPSAPSAPSVPSVCASGQSCSEEEESNPKPTVQKSHTVAVIGHLNKENRTEKRRQMVVPKSGHEARVTVQVPSSAHKSRHSLPPELPAVTQVEPRRKARRLGHSVPTAPLVPRSLSFSYNPPSASKTRTHPNFTTSHRFTLPHTAFDPQRQAGLPKPLPPLEVFRSNTMSRTVPARNTTFHSLHQSAQRRHVFLLPYGLSLAINKNTVQKL